MCQNVRCQHVRCQIDLRQVQVHVLAYLCLFGRLVEGLPLKLWKVLLLTHPAATVGNVGPDLQDLDRRVGICVPREHRSKSAQCILHRDLIQVQIELGERRVYAQGVRKQLARP